MHLSGNMFGNIENFVAEEKAKLIEKLTSKQRKLFTIDGVREQAIHLEVEDYGEDDAVSFDSAPVMGEKSTTDNRKVVTVPANGDGANTKASKLQTEHTDTHNSELAVSEKSQHLIESESSAIEVDQQDEAISAIIPANVEVAASEVVYAWRTGTLAERRHLDVVGGINKKQVPAVCDILQLQTLDDQKLLKITDDLKYLMNSFGFVGGQEFLKHFLLTRLLGMDGTASVRFSAFLTRFFPCCSKQIISCVLLPCVQSVNFSSGHGDIVLTLYAELFTDEHKTLFMDGLIAVLQEPTEIFMSFLTSVFQEKPPVGGDFVVHFVAYLEKHSVINRKDMTFSKLILEFLRTCIYHPTAEIIDKLKKIVNEQETMAKRFLVHEVDSMSSLK